MNAKKIARQTLERLGYTISRIPAYEEPLRPDTDLLPGQSIVDLERLATMSRSIRGMVTPEFGKLLYTLCFMQEQAGNVVEIGSWLGRSTSFLARAVRESGNGRFFAVDHFRGNVGKEHFYVDGRKDLRDLKAGFQDNMRRLGLLDSIELLDMPSDQAAEKIAAPVRLLFIDGDHTREGVQRDLDLFFPMLVPGSIVIFDDFDPGCPGLVEVVSELMYSRSFARAFCCARALVLKL